MFSITVLISSITIYFGLPIFICGMIGNLINIRLFWRARHNPCAFIFLFLSLINCIVLFYGLFIRILIIGFQLDWSTTNRFWCKTRAALTPASFLISLTCICLASIDRFLVSCRQEKYRKLSRLSLAKWAVILICIFWLLHFVPYLIYTELLRSPITDLMTCTLIRNEAFTNYLIYFAYPVYYGLLPSTTLMITGIMTYRNINKLQIVRQRQSIQKQLTSMMLILIPIILFSTLPYVIVTEYTVLTVTMAKSSNRRAVELLITNIVTTTCYITFACPFCAFFVSSRSFRNEAKMLFLCRKTTLTRTNQIQPYSTSSSRNIQSISMNTYRIPLNSTTIMKNMRPSIIHEE
ncbi:unnamed protein product [Rotaria sp. Silwood2]|nr:unnamed protein product [Rotaria sp. Silwood2]